MKGFLIALLVFALAVPVGGVAFAQQQPAAEKGGFTTESKNIEKGLSSVRGTGGDLIESIAHEASKGRNPAEEVTGVAVGGIVGLRKGLHRLGAGAIDLLTFWIPKKEPLVEDSTFK